MRFVLVVFALAASTAQPAPLDRRFGTIGLRVLW
jgi:hypothetical protein